MANFQSVVWVTIDLPSILNACISYSIASLHASSGPHASGGGWFLLQLRECLVQNACIGYSIVVIPVNISVVHCKVVYLSYHPTVCFKWVNMAFTDTKLKFQLINFVYCTYQLYCPFQLYHTNGTHATSMVDLCLLYCCSVEALAPQLLEIWLYSWKPLFLTDPDWNINFFRKWVPVRMCTGPVLTS